MTSAVDALRNVLADRYQVELESVELLAQGGKWVYRTQGRGGTDWVVRLLRADADAYHTHCLKNACAVLDYLERQSYRAERIVRDREGRGLVAWDGWLALVTHFAGAALRAWQGEQGAGVAAPSRLSSAENSQNELRAIGAALGRLHALPLDEALPAAITLPRRDLVWVGKTLEDMAADVPPALAGEYRDLVADIRRTDLCEGLPQALLHQDCHPSNIVRAPEGGVVFVDWDGSGAGPAVLDLGQLLGTCFTAEFAPDEDALAAVVAGYARHRRLDARERARLPDAMAFRSLVLLGAHFPKRVDGRLDDGDLLYGMTYGQWRAKCELDAEMADMAQRCFGALD